MKKSIIFFAVTISLITFSLALADPWQAPGSSAPEGNAEPPINDSDTMQTKFGSFTVGRPGSGILTAVYKFFVGDSGTASANFTASSTYLAEINGNVGARQYCNYGATLCKTLEQLSSGGSGFWTLSGSDIYNSNGGNVGIGQSSPVRKVDIKQTVDDITGGIGILNVAGSSRLNIFKIGDTGYVYSSAGNSPLILNTTGNVGVGTTNPGAKLEVNGQVKITGGSPGAGKVLTSDASGLGTWQTLGPSGTPETDPLSLHITGGTMSGDLNMATNNITNVGTINAGSVQTTGSVCTESVCLQSTNGTFTQEAWLDYGVAEAETFQRDLGTTYRFCALSKVDVVGQGRCQCDLRVQNSHWYLRAYRANDWGCGIVCGAVCF